jgi:Lrp/AsnC family leucine-responsive transcriptional regulator
MKFSRVSPEFDATDRAILELLQENCKQPLAAIGDKVDKVGMKAPSVVERIRKLEEAGVITGYVAQLDARRLGNDITVFIGVDSERPRSLGRLERELSAIDDILECHHVTGVHTLMLKAKTRNAATLERLIDRIRSLEGITSTETSVVLSTHVERSRIALGDNGEFDARPARRANRKRSRGAAK